MAINRSQLFTATAAYNYVNKTIPNYSLRDYQREALLKFKASIEMKKTTFHAYLKVNDRAEYDRALAIAKLFGLDTFVLYPPSRFPSYVSLRLDGDKKGIGHNATTNPYADALECDSIGEWTDECEEFVALKPPKPLPVPPKFTNEYPVDWEVDDKNETVVLCVGCNRITPQHIRTIHSQLAEIERRWETELPF